MSTSFILKSANREVEIEAFQQLREIRWGNVRPDKIDIYIREKYSREEFIKLIKYLNDIAHSMQFPNELETPVIEQINRK